MENNEEQFMNVGDELEFLSNFVPGALSEGPLQFEFKGLKNQSWVLTLHEKQCKLEEQPLEMDPLLGCWAWDLMNNCWKFIQYQEIETFTTWPPETSPEPF